MSKYGLNTRINLDAGTNALPIDVFVKIRDQLDQNPRGKDWRALVCAAETDFIIKPADVEKWSPAVSNGSAADKLLQCLCSQGMVIRELRDYLRKIQIDTYELGLDDYEDIVIQKQPPTDVHVLEGESLELEVQATGLPFPRYRWFFCPNGANDFKCLQGRTESTLCLNNVLQSNAGTYGCQIYNCMDPEKTKLTQNTLVAVSSNPHPVENSLTSEERRSSQCPPMSNGISLTSLKSHGNVLQLMGRYPDNGMLYNLIVGQPRDVTVAMNESFVLSVTTQGDPPISYQWFKNGMRLDGQTTPKLYVSHAAPSDFASYYCLVQNGIKTEQSSTAHVKEKIPESETEIVIISQPKSVFVNFGACALFSCEAKCRELLRYQWFKDGAPIPGETSSEIKLMNIQDRRVEGSYQCEISVDSLKDSKVPRRLTAGAVLTVIIPSVRDNVKYNPSDKVALLIGNSDYKCETQLKGSTRDVKILTESFRALNFKVVSLLNLTKPEIENAVLNFCELVDKNVYAVFYFCGHGFEENGLSYLMPTDAPNGHTSQHCVCAQHVLDNIQRKEPPFILMIMDICRQPGKMRSNSIPLNIEKSKVKGNTVFCYATSGGLPAFENKDGGLLVGHLHKLLKKDIGIDALVSELKEEFHSIPKHANIQIPELRSNLVEPRRSLVDQISTKGQTEAFQERHLRWMKVWDKPNKVSLRVDDVDAVVELDFQAEFSNLLAIFVSVTNSGRTDECMAQITNYSPNVSQFGQHVVIKRDRFAVVKTVLQDIQKLKDNLIVDVTIKFTVRGRHFWSCKRVDLGLPLVSKLKLWEQSNKFTPHTREGIEQSEYSESS